MNQLKKNAYGMEMVRWQGKINKIRTGGNAKCKFCGEERGRWSHYFECSRKPTFIKAHEEIINKKLEKYGANMDMLDMLKDFGFKRFTKAVKMIKFPD